MTSKVPVSVLIPVRDEERNLPDCLASAAWADEVVVYDSGSTDRTPEIAKAAGARVVSRAFDNFADHKNWALDHVDFRHLWIFILDADERVTPALADEVRRLVASGPAKDGYYVRRKNMFQGKWMRHGGWWPDWQMRLLHRGRARYEPRLVHEHVLLQGPAGFLDEHLVHHDFKGIERYFDRHNVYSSLEAVEIHRMLSGRGAGASLPKGALAKGPARRRFIKNLAYRWLPFRPLVKFFWLYVWQLGFLDGRIGLRFALLHAFYEYQIDLKLRELRDPSSPMSGKYAGS